MGRIGSKSKVLRARNIPPEGLYNVPSNKFFIVSYFCHPGIASSLTRGGKLRYLPCTPFVPSLSSEIASSLKQGRVRRSWLQRIVTSGTRQQASASREVWEPRTLRLCSGQAFDCLGVSRDRSECSIELVAGVFTRHPTCETVHECPDDSEENLRLAGRFLDGERL